MKGIAHFASGLCAASFIPGVVEQAAQGSLLIALGGACAMLPDTFDFRFAKFVERRDADIIPDREHPDPQALADAFAREFARVGPDRPRIVQFHPLRLGAVDWVTYALRFDVDRGDVVVTMNDVEARAHVGKLDYQYDGALEIIELGGPSLRLSRGENGYQIEFLPWHRQWSHSLVLAVVIGAVLATLINPIAGLVGGLGYAVHVLEDQLGYLGSNLFWPFTRRRFDGMKLLHSGDAIPNVVTVWLSLTLLLLNLDRARDLPLIATGPFLGFAVVLPAVLLIAVYARRKWRRYTASLQAERNRDVLAESEDAVG
ncbi:MAG: metal-dependent hydrolase [Candidatus Brachytrichaceae bacterium NZ_4S206]|jgi:membrane-bound metal-dependent hydrolase YbcI (DUF457 family)